MDRHYVSEFTAFMNQYLAEHPEVIADQKAGRSIYWDRKVDFQFWKKAEQDTVPDDSYGFHPENWHH